MGAIIALVILGLFAYSAWDGRRAYLKPSGIEDLMPYITYENVELDEVASTSESMIFNYLVTGQINQDLIRETEFAWFRANACRNPNLQRTFFSAGLSVVKNFRDKAGQQIMELRLDGRTCSENDA